jgi:uncharacterized protein YdeI (YjbR/CyaY-like superfamily)
MDPKIDQYFSNAKKWQQEMTQLRAILLSCKLTEELKWGKPCYTINGSNLIMIQAFKDHCDLGIFNGALLKDPKGLLVKAGEHTQAARQMRFTDSKEITKLTSVIKSYIKESIELENAGVKYESTENAGTIIIDELIELFKKDTKLKKAFEALTPGRQRAYLIYFSAAKQSATRISRINNYAARIMSGKGINDCTCGLSKRMPTCDGSHKYMKSL